MRTFAIAGCLALFCGGAALADTTVATAADKALCEERGGTVKGEGDGAFCATPAEDAVCAKKHGPAYGYDYRTGGCGTRSAEAGETSGQWQDVQ